MNSFYLSLNLGSFLFQYISYILRDEIFFLTQSFKFHDKAFLTSWISNQTAGEVVVMVFSSTCETSSSSQMFYVNNLETSLFVNTEMTACSRLITKACFDRI